MSEEAESAGAARSRRRRPTRETTRGGEREPVRRPARRPSPAELLDKAREQFTEITGRAVESVSALNRADDGWELNVEVVELAKVPDTASVLATYRVRLDKTGELAGYERLRRYARSQIEL